MIAYASSLDQGGPLVEAPKIAEYYLTKLRVMIKMTQQVITRLNKIIVDLKLSKDQAKNITIGIPKEYFSEDLDQNISDTLYQNPLRQFLKKWVLILKIVSLPNQ